MFVGKVRLIKSGDSAANVSLEGLSELVYFCLLFGNVSFCTFHIGISPSLIGTKLLGLFLEQNWII